LKGIIVTRRCPDLTSGFGTGGEAVSFNSVMAASLAMHHKKAVRPLA
jgi:hypothetical protein